MLNVRQILFSAVALAASAAALSGCGQRGPLYLPADPAAANRATLPDTLRPGSRAAQPQPAASAAPTPTPPAP